MSKLFEQLQKAAVARARMAPTPVVSPQAAADLAAARAAAERETAEIAALRLAEQRLASESQAQAALEQRLEAERRAEDAARARLEVERLAAEKSVHLAELERQAKEAEWARIAAEEAVRKAAAGPPLQQDRQPEASGNSRLSRSWLARGIAAIVLVAIAALAWYFAPSPTPATGSAPPPAKLPSSLKLDPKLDLARPR